MSQIPNVQLTGHQLQAHRNIEGFALHQWATTVARHAITMHMSNVQSQKQKNTNWWFTAQRYYVQKPVFEKIANIQKSYDVCAANTGI